MKRDRRNSEATIEEMLDAIRYAYMFTPEQWAAVRGLFRKQVEYMTKDEFVKFLHQDNLPGQMTILGDEEHTNSLELTR